MANEITDEATVDDEEQGPKGLRDAKKRLETELAAEKEKNTVLETRLMVSAFEQAGFDDLTKGIGKAVLVTYKGDPETKAIRAYAKDEYGWEPPEPTNPVRQAVNDAQGRVDGVDRVAEPVEPLDLQAQIAEAEKSGDVVKSIALKAQSLRIGSMNAT